MATENFMVHRLGGWVINCSITLDIRDKEALYEIKKLFGGYIYPVKDAKALRYYLRDKKVLIALSW